MRIWVRLPLWAACVVAGAVSPACSGRGHEAERPVATASLSLSKPKVPIGSAVTLSYKFQVAPDATFDRNYWVFVHVLDPEGEQMWTDDHLPPVPTTSWKPGQVVEYQRTIFVPSYPYIGEALVRLGLYDMTTGKRLALAGGQEAGRLEYVVTRFQLLPQSENIYLNHKEGWYTAEVDSKNPGNEWQWTSKSATLSFRNPKKDSTFYLEYDARPDLFTPPQQVTLRIGGAPIGQFVADAKKPTLKVFPLSAAQLGPGDMVELTLDVGRTFTPVAGDPRELGIRVFHASVEPRQGA